MRDFFFAKVLETLTALLALVFITFLLLYSMPGGPFDEEVSLNPLVKENLLKFWSLDKSFFYQFLHYVWHLLQGNFGNSMAQPGKSVQQILLQGFSQTLKLNTLAIALAYVFA
ncbi:MAG: ABC transporter permease, partial [Pseudobdellovibrionaceae bacterium]